MRKVLLLTTLLAFILTSSTWAADISGKWTITWWGPGADESFPLVIKAAGENITITGTHPAFKELTGTGTLKGDSISITLKSSSMDINLTGKVTGNKMSGTRKISSTGGGRGDASGGAAGGAPGGAAAGAQGDQGQAAGGQGGPGGAAGGAQGGQGQAAGGQGAPGGAAGGAQGGAQAQGNENWTAVKD